MSIKRRITDLEAGRGITKWITVRPVHRGSGPPFEALERGEVLDTFHSGEQLQRWMGGLPDAVGVIRIHRG